MASAKPLDVMVAAAFASGRILLNHFRDRRKLAISRKGRGDFVSNADLASEKRIAKILAASFPEYGFLMEESGTKDGLDGDHRWIVDPLDGTTNFLRGVPYFAVSLALQERGRIAAGLVYDPLRNEMFTALRGAGAYLNGRKVRASDCRQLSNGLFATGIPAHQGGKADLFSGRLAALRRSAGGIRSMGAAALDLAYVAAGRYDGYWEAGQAPWDIAAGMLLVEEAGGRCTDFAGKLTMLRSGAILASNRHLHRSLLVAIS